MTDYLPQAQALQVIDIWKPNVTGWVTPRVLWDPAMGHAPTLSHSGFKRWLDHGTAGTNTLRFWGEGGSAIPGNWTCAHYLNPKDKTQYADGLIHDTSNIIFKMIPDGYACNHTGECVAGVDNTNSRGMEYESRQDGTHDITEAQYIKGALVYSYDAALYGIPDWYRLAHGIVRVPWGERQDPFAGRFKIAYSFEIVQAVRRDARIWQLWGRPQPGF